MTTRMKAGPMLRYKKRLFKSDWREEYVILLDDSTLLWYKDKGQPDPDGMMVLADAPELLAFGLFAKRLPKRPELPEGYSYVQLLAFGEKSNFSLQWFLCESSDEVMEWMTAISNTLRTFFPDPDPIKSQESLEEENEGEEEEGKVEEGKVEEGEGEKKEKMQEKEEEKMQEKKEENEQEEKKSLKRENSAEESTNPNDTVAVGLAAGTGLIPPYTFCCGYTLGSGWGWFIDTDGISMSSCASHSEGPPLSPTSHFHEFHGEYLDFDNCDFGGDFIAF